MVRLRGFEPPCRLIRSQVPIQLDYSRRKGKMSHHTKSKGQIAETLTKLHLERLDYIVFTTTCDFSPVDMIALDTNLNSHRIQVKNRQDGVIPRSCNWSDSNGTHRRIIDTNLFDYFALVCDEKVAFLPSSYIGKKIRFTMPETYQKFIWWEDCRIGSPVIFRTIRDFGLKAKKVLRGPRPQTRKVFRPESVLLRDLVWQKPLRDVAKDYQVSDITIKKWCNFYDIETPPRGYWLRPLS